MQSYEQNPLAPPPAPTAAKMDHGKAFAVALLVGVLAAGVGGYLAGRSGIATGHINVEVENNQATTVTVSLYVNTDLHSSLTLSGLETRTVPITVSFLGDHGIFEVRVTPTTGTGDDDRVTIAPGETESVHLGVW